MTTIQTRTLDLQCRFVAEGDTGIIEGYASRWNEADYYGDVLQPGAFSASLAEHRSRGTWPAMLSLHRDPCGVWDTIEERPDGLYVRGHFALATTAGREAYEAVKAGAMRGLSISFLYDDFTPGPNGTLIVRAVTLMEISCVPVPAAPRAQITNVRQIGGNTLPEATTPTPEAPAVTTPENRNTPAPQPDIAAMQTRMAQMQTRMDEMEVRSQRLPAAARNENEQREREFRSLSTFMRNGDLAEIRAAATDNVIDGGWFVLPTVDLTIRSLLRDISPMRRLAEVVSISTKSYDRFFSLGKGGATKISERAVRPQDTPRPELIKHSYETVMYYAAPTATQQMLDDAVTDIATWLIKDSVQKFALGEGEDFLIGDGLDGAPKGLLAYETASEKDFVRDWGKFQYVAAGATTPTDAQLADALINLEGTLRAPYKTNARWLMNNNTAIRLRQIKDGVDRYLWREVGNIVEGTSHPLLGYPVDIDNNMPDIGSEETPIAFGDMRQAYIVIDRAGIRVKEDDITRKGYVIFDTYKRTGGGAGDFNALKFLKISAS